MCLHAKVLKVYIGKKDFEEQNFYWGCKNQNMSMTSQLKGLHMENLMQCAVVHPYVKPSTSQDRKIHLAIRLTTHLKILINHNVPFELPV